MTKKHLAIAILLPLSAYANSSNLKSSHSETQSVKPKVIYGDDDRKDLYELDSNSPIYQVALATAAVVKKDNLENNPIANIIKIKGDSFGSSLSLCEDEPYFNQPSSAFCSAFLVAPNLMATAGHCFESERDCAEAQFVFGFDMKDHNNPVTEVHPKNVYSCAKIVKQVLTFAADYALIELDRPVGGITPLKLRQQGRPERGEELFVVGHPMGLPTKVAGGAKVRYWSEDGEFFNANLDTYGGNSGSAVFNSKTFEVEGILVRGENDFVNDNVRECRKSNRCPSNECRGEDVTKIGFINDLISSNHTK